MALKEPIGEVRRGNSFIHRVPPGAKLLMLFEAVTAVMGASGWTWLAPPFLLLFAGALASGVGIGYFLKGLKSVTWLCAAGVLLHGLSTPGRPLGAPWFTVEGTAAGLLVGARLFAAAGFARLVVVTTGAGELIGALERLFSPLDGKWLPVKEFFLSLVMALEIFPLLGEEVETAREHRKTGPGGIRGALYAAEGVFRRTMERADSLFPDDFALPPPAVGQKPGALEYSLVLLFAGMAVAEYFPGVFP